MRLLLIIAFLFFSLHVSFAQEAENNIETTEKTAETERQVKLASPIGAMVRSAFVPGWGTVLQRQLLPRQPNSLRNRWLYHRCLVSTKLF